MKKLVKLSICFLLILSVMSAFVTLNASAAGTSISFSSKTVKPGDNVTVTVTLNADEGMYAYDISLSYNSSIVKYVSGAHVNSGGKVKIVDSASGEKSKSFSIVFNTLKEGSAAFSVSAEYTGTSHTKTVTSSGSLSVKKQAVASQSTTSKTPAKPSTNANLSALTLTGGTLTPDFNRNTTEYTVTVENSVATTEITATSADKNAKIEGAGTLNLEVGDNEHSIVVTAADKKTTKTYKLKIRRATVEETLALNPTATVIEGEMHHLKTDITEMPVPNGYKADTAVYNGIDVGVFKSEDEKYTLYPITNATTNVTEYYTYKALRDEFVPLKYVNIGGNMYILLDYPESYEIPKGYFETAVQIGDKTVNALCSEDEALKDIYFLYCYQGGVEQFFSYDATDASIQRSPDLTVKMDEQASMPTGVKGIVYKFKALDKLTKILIVALAVCVVIIILLIILLLTSRKGGYKGKRLSNLFEDDEELNTFLSIDDSVFQQTEEKTEE